MSRAYPKYAAAIPAGAIEFTPGYWVTSDGRVYSVNESGPWAGVRQMRVGTQTPPRPGAKASLYVRCRTANKPSEIFFIHKLVAQHFLPPKPEGATCIRHLDGDHHHNDVSNLAWGTMQENMDDREQHGRTARGERMGNSKLTAETVREIKRALAAGASQRALAEELGVTHTCISDLSRGRTWKHVEP